MKKIAAFVFCIMILASNMSVLVHAATDIIALPADGTATADFDAENIETQDIYDYIEPFVTKYPKYIKKEVMGKDESGIYDINRYVLYNGKYFAYEKENYPHMFAWKCEDTVLYSVSVSPRIDDTLYTTQYIGNGWGTVTAVCNADESRTVLNSENEEFVFVRYAEGDVSATLLFYNIENGDSKTGKPLYDKNGNEAGAVVGNFYDGGVENITDADGIKYARKPMNDIDSFGEEPVTIVILANEHGMDFDPAEPAIICARVINKMCSGTGDEFIQFMRSIKAVFIPVANPWGFNTKKYSLKNVYGKTRSYCNYNMRNFHRNFDTKGWEYEGDGSADGSYELPADAMARNAYYGGSEIETQYLMNTLYGATMGFSIHCLPTTSSSQGRMVIQTPTSIASDEDYLNLKTSLRKTYSMILTNSVDCDPDSYGKATSYILANCKYGGAMFEMNRRVRYAQAMHVSKIMKADYAEMSGVVKLFASRVCLWPGSEHVYNKTNTVDPTCTEGGYSIYTCEKCGKTMQSDFTDALGHDYEEVIIPSTCSEVGYTTHTCTACGASYVDNETETIEHTWDNGIVTKESTTTEEGITTYTCTVCGATKEESIPLKHTIYFNTSGGSGDTEYVIATGQAYSEVMDKLPSASMTGMIFMGWYNDGKLLSADDIYDLEEDITFDAMFVPSVKLTNKKSMSINENMSAVRVNFKIGNEQNCFDKHVIEVGGLVGRSSSGDLTLDNDGNLITSTGQAKLTIFKSNSQIGNIKSVSGEVVFSIFLYNISDRDREYDFRGYAIYEDDYGNRRVVYTSAYKTISYNLLAGMM